MLWVYSQIIFFVCKDVGFILAYNVLYQLLKWTNEYRSSFINWIDLMTNIWEGEKRRQLEKREEPIPQNTSPSTWRTLFSFRVRTQPPLRRRQSQSSVIQFTAFFTLPVPNHIADFAGRKCRVSSHPWIGASLHGTTKIFIFSQFFVSVQWSFCSFSLWL
jgi:hypothetical protein